jgi:hypothetical protein
MPINSRTVNTKSFKKRCADLPGDVQRMIIGKRVDIDMYAWIKIWRKKYMWNNSRPDDDCLIGYTQKDFLRHIEEEFGSPYEYTSIPMSRRLILKKAVQAEAKIKEDSEKLPFSGAAMVAGCRREYMEENLRTLSFLGGRVTCPHGYKPANVGHTL